ncbi:MAG: hypothetical protein HY533_04640 [Chloroflexi bacterium]|nr:hypothetical protein [Chloroflexota bacterium]
MRDMDTVQCYMHDPQGRRPHKLSTRPRLPQASLHCPVLSEGNGLGWLVYPNTRSAWEVERVPGYLQIRHHASEHSDFEFDFLLQAGEDGSRVIELLSPEGVSPDPNCEKRIKAAMDKVFHSMQNPAGSIRLLGNCWFKTPEGWDSVWTGVTNLFDPPLPHAFTVRVQTDWYVGTPVTEVLYQLRLGERLRVDTQTPMSMVAFVPRQEPKVEFPPYPEELRAETARQMAEKYQPEYQRAEREISPYNVWYARHQRP